MYKDYMNFERPQKSRLNMGIIIFLGIILWYYAIAVFAFQWRNPLANSVTTFKEFKAVITWKKLPDYQKEWQWTHDEE